MALNEQQFLETLVFERKLPISRLQPAVEAMRELDKHYEALTSKWTQASCGATVATLVAGILAGPVNEGRSSLLNLLAAGLLLACLTSWFVRSRHKRKDTEDRRYLLLARLLRVLKVDVGADQPLYVRLDLNRPDQKHKLERTGTARSWNVKYYRDDWLTLEGRFLDGTAFRIGATELFQHRSRWARGSSGKSKYKTKTKSFSEFSVRLWPKEKRYQRLSDLGRGERSFLQLPEHAAVKALTVEDGGLALKVKCKLPWKQEPGQEDEASGSYMVSMMLLSLYQVLNLSRRLTKKAG